MKSVKWLFTLLLLFSALVDLKAQDPNRFQFVINGFSKMEIPDGDLIVITGSSSVRFWGTVQEDCADEKIINTGFGGSEASDLLYHLDAAVLRFKPVKVFIYEGDNDINSGKTPETILKTMSQIVGKIRSSLPETQIYIIGTKPSPARWQYEPGYLAVNKLLSDYAEQQEQVSYIDVWNPMLNDAGRPKPHIFIGDSLHMNPKGYAIWTEAICPSMD